MHNPLGNSPAGSGLQKPAINSKLLDHFLGEFYALHDGQIGIDVRTFRSVER